jgi:hypothetical protein
MVAACYIGKGALQGERGTSLAIHGQRSASFSSQSWSWYQGNRLQSVLSILFRSVGNLPQVVELFQNSIRIVWPVAAKE